VATDIDHLYPEEDQDEEVEAYPVADGSNAGHLCCMLQGGRARCTGAVVAAPVRGGDARKEIEEKNTLELRFRCGVSGKLLYRTRRQSVAAV
jgi:hypothetical protein